MNLETMYSQTAKKLYFVSFLIMYVCVWKQAYTCIAVSAEARKDTESLGRIIGSCDPPKVVADLEQHRDRLGEHGMLFSP